MFLVISNNTQNKHSVKNKHSAGDLRDILSWQELKRKGSSRKVLIDARIEMN